MRTCLAVLLSTLVIVSSGCQVSRALKQPIPASAAVGIQDERTQRIGQVIRDTMCKEDIPGVSVAVIDHGQIVWAQGFGYRDIAKRLPVDTDTQFQAGSISKPVTALGVLLLKESGQLDLDKDVNGYFKNWHLDSKWPDKPVTLRLLLCHRAGMVPHGFIGFSEAKEPPSLAEVMTRHTFMNGPVKVSHPPGSEFRYSGGGYCIIQKVMEDITAEPFEVVMSKTLLELACPRENVPVRVRGYPKE